MKRPLASLRARVGSLPVLMTGLCLFCACESGEILSSCPLGEELCLGECVDLSSDPRHCGGCDRRCSSGSGLCAEGVCVSECGVGLTDCDGRCLDLGTDRESCGACGEVCPAPPNAEAVCLGGECGSRCLAGWSDLTEEPGCETACAAGGDDELCNGLDDDCDGQVDDGFACAAGQEVACVTACGTTGVSLCSATCELPAPEACQGQEQCNGHDDDCDGLVDEDFPCQPGQSEEQSCGACDGGSQERSCSAACEWSGWGECRGARGDLPVEPATGAAVCPPYYRPAVFFAPHPDDETLAMAGAILEHLDAGREVFVELMTHGSASGVRTTLANDDECSWHSGRHEYVLEEGPFGDARVREFLDATTRLGVTGVFVSDFVDGELTTGQVNLRIGFWLTEGGAELSLKGTVGSEDLTSSGTYHDDHQAVWSALLACGHSDIRGYFVQLYRGGLGDPDRTVSIASFCERKGYALDAYALWDPPSGRYAIGYHSVPGHFDGAHDDCREFLEIP